ncbi:MAG: phospholipid carrier-dependent glycosyltransferase [Victivallaceae bacterium]|nr:phospholipid carrier-dependent glycosyltransferase [Victivallaceae bacterium]
MEEPGFVSQKMIWGIIIVFLLIYIAPLGVRPMLTPDEFRYGEIPREMIASGDWIVPKLNGFRYFEKPIFGYWLNAVSILIFGENAFGVRLPVAICTGLTAWLIWFLVRQIRHDEQLALLSAAVFLTSGLVFGVGTFAVLDAQVNLFITASMVFFLKASEIRKFNTPQILWLILFGISCGLAFLTKGFLSFVVPGLAIFSYLAWQKRWREIFILPWIPLAAAILVILPWAIAVHLKEPDYWRYFIVVEHWERFLGKNDSQHPEPFWFYIPIFLAGSLPWALMLPAAFYLCRKKLVEIFRDRLFLFSFCSVVFPFLFFSACSGKLGTYVLPCFPGWSILTAWLLLEMLKNPNGERYCNIHNRILAALLIVGALGFVTFQLLAESGFFRGVYDYSEKAIWLTAVAGGLISALFLVFSVNSKTISQRLSWIFLFAALPLAMSMLAAPGRFFEGKAQGVVLEKYTDAIPKDAIVVSHPNMVHAACWVFKRNDIILYGSSNEMRYGLEYPDSRHRLINDTELHKLIKNTPEGKLVFMMRGDFRERIPAAPYEIYKHNLMIARY